ncbi:MAG: phosphohistidine phosphatase SixA [Bryobacteraceae bacterium]
MQVYLLRHGIAEEARIGMNDSDRELTTEGRRRLRETLRALANVEVSPSLIVSSTLTRALQTAEIARSVFKTKASVLRTKALTPSATVEQVWDEIRAHRGESELMLVGHEPQFSNLAAYLLGARELRVDFKKGAVLRLDLEGFGAQPRGTLRWFFLARMASPATRGAEKAD